MTRARVIDNKNTCANVALLFGCTRVYRNMFNQDKDVYCYNLVQLADELGLTRNTVRIISERERERD
jgi:hypothetical protein